MSLLMMVLTPLTSATDEHLGGYRLGTYPAQALRGLEVYRPPRGLVRVEAQDVERWVSPISSSVSFSASRRSCPKFLLVRHPRLLQKLERLLGRINREGISTPTLHVMSGYRTPFYNHAIGNVKYSRHIYGDAADVFVDASPQDGMMDDVNHDGTIDKRDAQFLAGLVESMFHESFFTPLVGGVGTYAANEAHGPFLHVDTRGTRARW
ncbi:MAG: D-Ala-D-Ala carboxypeptidase family metallohydrolase [Candidatus Eisenbacteria bacterium]